MTVTRTTWLLAACLFLGVSPARAQVPATTPVPPGPYLQSCGNAHVQLNLLIANCRRADQTVAQSVLILPCAGGIDNVNGVLTCSRGTSKPPAAPTPAPAPHPAPVKTAAKIVATRPANGTIEAGTLTCGLTCSTSLPLGTPIELKATPDLGYAFASWGGACSGQALGCVLSPAPTRPRGQCPDQSVHCLLTLSDDVSVSAAFKRVGVSTVGVTVSGSGYVGAAMAPTPPMCGGGHTCSFPVTTGASVELFAVPGPGHALGSWSGACSGTARTCTLVVNSGKGVGYTFK